MLTFTVRCTWDVLPVAQVPPATNTRMLLHCGGQVIERDALFGIQTPPTAAHMTS
jgi:hypothetical protein